MPTEQLPTIDNGIGRKLTVAVNPEWRSAFLTVNVRSDGYQVDIGLDPYVLDDLITELQYAKKLIEDYDPEQTT